MKKKKMKYKTSIGSPSEMLVAAVATIAADIWYGIGQDNEWIKAYE